MWARALWSWGGSSTSEIGVERRIFTDTRYDTEGEESDTVFHGPPYVPGAPTVDAAPPMTSAWNVTILHTHPIPSARPGLSPADISYAISYGVNVIAITASRLYAISRVGVTGDCSWSP